MIVLKVSDARHYFGGNKMSGFRSFRKAIKLQLTFRERISVR